MRWLLAIALAISAWAAHAQTVIVRTNEISGNVSPSETIQGVAGVWRFTLYATDGGDPAELSAPVRFVVVDPADGHAVTSVPTVVSSGYIYRATVQIVQRTQPPFTLPYWAQYIRTDLDPSDTERILWWAEVSVTSVPPASAIVNASVVVTGAIAAVQKTASGPPADFDYTSKILTLNTAFVGSGGSGLITNVVEAHSNRWVPAQSTLIIDTNENLRSGSATINGLPITNNASLAVSGQLQYWIEQYRTSSIANFTGARLVPTSVTNFSYFGNTYGLFWATNGAFSLRMPDNTITGGQARGLQAVDLQLTWWVTGDSDKVAAGSYSFLGAGAGNRAGGQFSAVVGGRINTVNGNYSAAIAAESATVAGSHSLCAAGSGWIGGGSRNLVLGGGGNIYNGWNNAIIASGGAEISPGSWDRYYNIILGANGGYWDGDWLGIYGDGSFYTSYNLVSVSSWYRLHNVLHSLTLGSSFYRATNSVFAVAVATRIATNVNSYMSSIYNSHTASVHTVTNAVVLNSVLTHIRNSDRVTALGTDNLTITNSRNIVAIGSTGVVAGVTNWVYLGNIKISLNGTNNPPLEGAIAFDNGNWRFAVSNQWRTPLYE